MVQFIQCIGTRGKNTNTGEMSVVGIENQKVFSLHAYMLSINSNYDLNQNIRSLKYS